MKPETITAYCINPFLLILCNSQISLCSPDSGETFIRKARRVSLSISSLNCWSWWLVPFHVVYRELLKENPTADRATKPGFHSFILNEIKKKMLTICVSLNSLLQYVILAHDGFCPVYVLLQAVLKVHSTLKAICSPRAWASILEGVFDTRLL